MNDRLERKLREEEEDARTNPLYAVDVKYVPAWRARQMGIRIDPNLADDAQIGILNHEVAFDPRYTDPEGPESPVGAPESGS